MLRSAAALAAHRPNPVPRKKPTNATPTPPVAAARTRRRAPRLGLGGSLWLAAGDERLAGHGRVGLLRAVAEQGSITHAAKAFGMSYKAAWDAINTMNTRSGTALVERVSGGRGGGATRLTEHGRRLVQRYEQLDAVHQRFLQLLDGAAMDLNREVSLLEVINVKTSARNQWVGTISAIRSGAVNDEVELTLPGGQRLAAIITHESTARLALRTQMSVIALVKAPAVLLVAGLGAARVSARNRLAGTVQTVTPGAVNAEVLLEAGGLMVVAIVPSAAVDELGLAPGAAIDVFVKASDIVLAVAG